jgi:hypothetical protein
MYAGVTYNARSGLRSMAQFRWVDAYPVDNVDTKFLNYHPDVAGPPLKGPTTSLVIQPE